MRKHRIPTKEQFDILMTWLGSNAEDSGGKYEHIRQTLVKLFIWHACWDAEDLADETIDRVMRKVPQIMIDYSGDPALYFYGVAKRLLKERWRQDVLRNVSESLESRLPGRITCNSEEADRKFECLEKCIEKLPPENRELILDYYQQEKRAKIDFRREIAKRLGVDVENLRVRVFRIRASLFKCIEKCMENLGVVQ